MDRNALSGRAVAALASTALLGGGVALGGAALFGDLGGKTVVREVVQPTVGAPASFARQGNRLTINQIYSRSAPGVVQITAVTVRQVQPDPFFGNPFGSPSRQTQQALGSGFVLDKAGHIITNYHVVQGASRVEVSFSNNEQVKAHVVGSDPSTDIAVLQIGAHSRALTPLQLGNSDSVRVGDSVVALGITAQPIDADAARLFHLPVKSGLLVDTVKAGSGAADAGLRASTNNVTVSGETWPLGGDIIVSVDGVATPSIERLRDAVAAKQPGDTIKLGIVRDKKHETLAVKLGRQPSTTG